MDGNVAEHFIRSLNRFQVADRNAGDLAIVESPEREAVIEEYLEARREFQTVLAELEAGRAS